MLKLHRCDYHGVIVNARRARWRHAYCVAPSGSTGMEWQNVVLHAEEIEVLIPASLDGLDPGLFCTPYRASASLGRNSNG